MIRAPGQRRRGATIRCDETGATLVEFAFVAPILLLMILGLFDMAHTQYTTAMINGAMQKAARDLTLETAPSQAANIDQRVIDHVRTVAPNSATIRLEKKSHFDFEDIGEPEDYNDSNGDGVCNDGEPFVDANRNGQWDPDRGLDGIGGAHDAVLYTAVVTYDRLFPMYGLMGMSQQVTLRSTTAMRNQPYDVYDDGDEMGSCG